MIKIPAGIFASVAPFIGKSYSEIDKVHVTVGPEKSYIEAINAHEFCQHALNYLFSAEEKHVLITPTKDLVKACKAKGAATLEILDNLSMRVVDTRDNVIYIHPVNAKTCEARQFPDMSFLVEKLFK